MMAPALGARRKLLFNQRASLKERRIATLLKRKSDALYFKADGSSQITQFRVSLERQKDNHLDMWNTVEGSIIEVDAYYHKE